MLGNGLKMTNLWL